MRPDWFLVVRKQFDVIGLTADKGWTDEKVREFIRQPRWYQQYTWQSEAQREEWLKYVKEVYKCRDYDANLIDLNHGWKDEVQL